MVKKKVKVNKKKVEAKKRLIALRKVLQQSTMALVIAGMASLMVFIANNTLNKSLESRISASNPPNLVTAGLARARVGERYRVVVMGTDQDMSESLMMSASGLPEGLSLQQCKAELTADGNRLRCFVTGVPSERGIYQVSVVITDYEGNADQRSYELRVE